ncbi:MAG TPA: flagellar motor stator protein MotA, partial [Rhodothermales bacterium]
MWIFIGYGVILAAVFGGFVLGGGHMAALFQPLELLTIGGAAAGAFVVGNGLKVTKQALGAIPSLMKASKFSKEFNLDVLSLIYDFGVKARKNGLMSLEKDADYPEESDIFKAYPRVAAVPFVVEFITDYLRVMVSGNMESHELEALMDEEIETFQEAGEVPVKAVQATADALPGFGIVAAVMGVVHTMESIGLPPEELGMLIARALVGTFLGILLAYGFVAPIATLMEHRLNESIKTLQCLKISLLQLNSGALPTIAVEFGR